ncbi:MAG TPA: hypothetical protein VJM34_16410 [Novosphingobium sp.]|nr:hypothetical protein [Novosphingobium sp.]
MAQGRNTISREERLAAKLRENLHRRKTQNRAQSGAKDAAGNDDTDASAPLPKSPSSR